VSNLPQLQAKGRVGSDGGLAEAMEVAREPELPAPVKAAPKSTVRVAGGLGAVPRVAARLISVCAGACGAVGRGRGGGRVAVRAG